MNINLTRIFVFLIGLFVTGLIEGQTIQNLSLKATFVGASTESEGHAANLVCDNRYGGNAKYWSSYHGDENMGQYEYVELKTDFDIPKSTIYLSYIKRLENKTIRCVIDFFNEHSGKLIN